jgi:ABC-type multidrug transport system permease subunit
MTNHDHHRDGEQAENTKPNYTLRRIKTLLAVIACTASATLLFTWRTADSQTATILVSVIYILTCLWLTVRFAPRD